MFQKSKYKVYKCNENTEEQIHKEIPYDDEYGSTHWEQKPKWVPFKSDLYYLLDEKQVLYTPNRYSPIAPSGKFSIRFAGLYNKVLRNLDCVGYFDGEKFDIEIPYLYTSIQELEPLDVFRFAEDHVYRAGIFKSDPVKTIKSGTLLVLETFKDNVLNRFEVAGVYEQETGEPHVLYGNLAVEKVGKIILERKLVLD
jgi:hypothetical protein